MIMNLPIFKIGDTVYHTTPDSEPGIITDISYSYASNMNKYLVSTSFNKSDWCNEVELSNVKKY